MNLAHKIYSFNYGGGNGDGGKERLLESLQKIKELQWRN